MRFLGELIGLALVTWIAYRLLTPGIRPFPEGYRSFGGFAIGGLVLVGAASSIASNCAQFSSGVMDGYETAKVRSFGENTCRSRGGLARIDTDAGTAWCEDGSAWKPCQPGDECVEP